MANDIHLKLGFYKHFKTGDIYEVIGVANHSETLETLVVYKSLYYSTKFGNNPLWVRPLSMFMELKEKDGKQIPRFEFMGKELKNK